MSTRAIIKELIQRLYDESIRNGFNFQVSEYDSSGRNYFVAEDGTFLGTLSGVYDARSIFNRFGSYGSKYSTTSIFNPFSQYGSKYSPQSPVSRFAATPPKIFINNQYFGRLTANKFAPDAKPVDVFLFYVLQQMGLLDDRMDDLIELISRI
jgi:hypothetical protein